MHSRQYPLAQGIAPGRGTGMVVVWVALALVGCGAEPGPVMKTSLAPLPIARLGLATAVVDGQIYAIGGYAQADAPGLQVVESYDPAADTWTSRKPMPTGRRWLAAAVVNGAVYAIGGHVGVNTPGLAIVEAYDPATDTWSAKQPMPTARLGLAAAVLNDRIYAVGGADTGSGQGGSGGSVLGTLEEYDPATDTWTSKQDMPTPRATLAFVALGGKLYAIGGGKNPGTGSPLVEIYDPATDTWTAGAGMPTARSALCGAVVGGEIYLVGGANGVSTPTPALYSTNEAYDPVSDSWTTRSPMPTARYAHTCAAASGKVYAIGGAAMVLAPHPGVHTNEAFDPVVDDWTGRTPMASARYGLLALR